MTEATLVRATTRLNATLEAAPESVTRWKVTKVRKFRAIDGEGFEAQVTLDGKPAGTFAQEGHGGGTWFRHDNREAADAFDALCREWATACPAVFSLPVMTVVDKKVVDDGTPNMVSGEHVCDSLVENFQLAKKLDAMVKKGKTPVLTREQAADADNGGEYGVEFGVKAYGSINGPVDHPQVRAMVTERKMLVWANGQWQDLTAEAR